MDLGINLSFALKRWPEPERWAAIVAERLGLRSIQFTLDLIDAWWPQAERAARGPQRHGRSRAGAARIALRRAAGAHPPPSGSGRAAGPLGAARGADAA